jgi:hypothetical protein
MKRKANYIPAFHEKRSQQKFYKPRDASQYKISVLYIKHECRSQVRSLHGRHIGTDTKQKEGTMAYLWWYGAHTKIHNILLPGSTVSYENEKDILTYSGS